MNIITEAVALVPYGKYTLAGMVIDQGESWVTVKVTHVAQDGEELSGHHLVGREMSFSAQDALIY